MGRKPKIRTSYSDDAQFLLRLAKAIESDEKRPLAWRKDMMAKTNGLAMDLLSAPEGEHWSKVEA